MIKKILGWGTLAFIIFYAITQPTEAAGTARTILTGLGRVGDAIASFVASIT